MNKRLQTAIEKIQSLSEERQAYAASILEQVADLDEEPYRLSNTERALVREGLEDIATGRTVSDEDMTAFWERNRT